jgi:hypothetical protein
MADRSCLTHVCACPVCCQGADGEVAHYHAGINSIVPELHERGRRLFAGLLAAEHGHGGVSLLAQITGLSRTTILRGQRELEHGVPRHAHRIRRPGGGRPRVEKKGRPS